MPRRAEPERERTRGEPWIRRSVLSAVVLVTMVAGCPCSAPPEHGGDEASGSGAATGDEEEGGDTASDEGDGEADRGDDADAGQGDPPRSQSDLPPPSSTRPSGAVRRAKDPPAPTASDDTPLDPPDEPPENPFGYDRPVEGCLEGRVYLVRENVRDIPRRWRGLEQGHALWACELNVEPKVWEDGLPGMGERYQWLAVRYEGAFRVTEPGTWKFRLRSDDGSRLLVDGELVVDNGGMHATMSRDGEVELEPGDHTIVVEYVQGAHHVALQLLVTPPDGEEGLFSVRWK